MILAGETEILYRILRNGMKISVGKTKATKINGEEDTRQIGAFGEDVNITKI